MVAYKSLLKLKGKYLCESIVVLGLLGTSTHCLQSFLSSRAAAQAVWFPEAEICLVGIMSN